MPRVTKKLFASVGTRLSSLLLEPLCEFLPGPAQPAIEGASRTVVHAPQSFDQLAMLLVLSEEASEDCFFDYVTNVHEPSSLLFLATDVTRGCDLIHQETDQVYFFGVVPAIRRLLGCYPPAGFVRCIIETQQARSKIKPDLLFASPVDFLVW